MSRGVGITIVIGLVALAAIGGRGGSGARQNEAPSYVNAAAPVIATEPAAPPPVTLASLPAATAPDLTPPMAGPPIELSAPTLTVQRDAVLRREPSRKGSQLASAGRGEDAVERSRKGAWREVEFADGRRGWLPAATFDTPSLRQTTTKTDAPDRKPLHEVEAPSAKSALAVAAIAALIVQESRASYGGSCGCPDDRDRGGRRCGGRSAYSRAGGRSLFCYVADVPAALIATREARG